MSLTPRETAPSTPVTPAASSARAPRPAPATPRAAHARRSAARASPRRQRLHRQPQGRRLHRAVRARPPALRRRPRPVQAQPDGAPRPHVDRAPRHAGPGRVRQAAAQGPGRARRLPGPRDDQRLPPVAPRGPVRGPAHEDPARADRRARTPEDLERRLLLRRRGLHDRRGLPRDDPERRASRSTAPTSTSAWSPARAQGIFTAEDARTSPKAMLQRHFEPQPDGGWLAKPELRANGALRKRGPAAYAGPDRAATTSSSAATP